ncbi:glycosyltransferase family 2 protein [Aquabacterium sp.]|uniref:glycosyltransferase family 2 protein n=1 Tax=Aquabacterium sp. TaxID=1872578 RepID=UPI0035ADD550
MAPKVAAIAMVKDECDIIEHFVRWNLKVVDHLFVIDHNSHDATPEILILLKEEGLPITIWHEERIDHNQAAFLSDKMLEIADSDEFEFIIPLDADEFINCEYGHFGTLLSKEIKPAHCGVMPWITYIPQSDDCLLDAPPKLHETFMMQNMEGETSTKTVIPNDVAKSSTLAEGNHFALHGGLPVAPILLPAALLHVPIRSAPQIIKKALNGSHKLSIKETRAPREGAHWDALAAYIRRRNYTLTKDDMVWLARHYAMTELEAPTKAVPEVAKTGPKVGIPFEQLKYANLGTTRPMRAIDALAHELCGEIRTLRIELAQLHAAMSTSKKPPSVLRSFFSFTGTP